ncbi:hypothetical protein RJ639_037660 [Escallonia herrerae]|uniref:Uncharacterized protein n=1 Tax=Escallonia herrerae TaxID=1293975 RepID=A0AA88WPB4_9ASTE|nr:hypothetical protein RJ639_037660 [Escallonia herrerae]
MENTSRMPVINDISKLAKFDGSFFRRWKSKMYFFLATLKIAYVLTIPTPIVDEAADEAIKQTAMKQKQRWEEDDTYCKGYILGGLSDTLYDVYEIKYANITAKELWDDLDSKCKTEDVENKKFLINKLFDFCMIDSKNRKSKDTVDEDQVHPTPEMGEGGELRRSKRARIEKTYGPDFYQFLVEGSRNEGATKNLATELGQYEVRVNYVSSTGVVSRSNFGVPDEKVEASSHANVTLKGKILRVKDVAMAALFLASTEASYVSGLNLVVDGGYSVVNPTMMKAAGLIP